MIQIIKKIKSHSLYYDNSNDENYEGRRLAENDALDSIRLMASPAKTRNTIPTPTNPTRAISALINLTSEVPAKTSSSIGNIHQIRGASSLIE